MADQHVGGAKADSGALHFVGIEQQEPSHFSQSVLIDKIIATYRQGDAKPPMAHGIQLKRP